MVHYLCLSLLSNVSTFVKVMFLTYISAHVTCLKSFSRPRPHKEAQIPMCHKRALITNPHSTFAYVGWQLSSHPLYILCDAFLFDISFCSSVIETVHKYFCSIFLDIPFPHVPVGLYSVTVLLFARCTSMLILVNSSL